MDKHAHIKMFSYNLTICSSLFIVSVLAVYHDRLLTFV